MKFFYDKYPELRSELIQVKKIMKDTIGHPEKFISEPIDEMIDSGGKMLRPSLLILSSKFGNYDSKRVLPLAAAVELFHTATLMHDDIIDQSKLRRGSETIQSKYGKDVAVYSGDYIIAKSFLLMNEQYDQALIQNLSKKVVKICAGELKQYNFKYNAHISIYDYIKIAAAKTATLFALSMYIGSYLGDLDEKDSRLFGLTGLRTGIAYQIIDDCLDYSGTEETIQKSTQNDLKQGFYTLPILCALKNDCSKRLQQLLKESHYDDNDISKIYHYVIENRGVADAKQYAQRYTKKAYEALDRLPDCQSKIMLSELLTSLLERQY